MQLKYFIGLKEYFINLKLVFLLPDIIRPLGINLYYAKMTSIICVIRLWLFCVLDMFATRIESQNLYVWSGYWWEPCKCNGRSSTCYFDWDLYKETGQGGRCKNCQGDTEGPYCERCKDNFFMKDGQCTPCLCDFKGSIHTRCKENGQCFCKPGVEGLRCDTCEDESYELVSDGCRRRHGTVQTENDINALSCFCYGHSSVCQRAFGYVKHVIISTFKKGTEEWTALTSNGDTVPLLYDPTRQSVHVSSLMSLSTTVYFVASDKYLGDQRSSYNQALSFTLKIGEPRFTISEHDVVIEGENMKVSISITQQNNNLPMTSETKFKFTLSELPVFGWKPQLDTYKFLTLLSNLTALKIRANLSPEGETFLYDVKLESARPSTNGETANWVENCTCPRGYVGQFCEACDQGYTRNIPVDSRFAKCIPCKYGDVSYLYDRETECPPCFKMVQHVVRDLKFRLDEIIQLLSDKQGNRQNVVDLISNKTLSNISQNIIDLLDKAQHLTGQEFIILKDLKDLKAKLFNSTKLSTQIKLKVQKTKSFSDLGKERIFMVMEQIENVSIILLNMKNLLSNITRDYFKNSSNVIKIFQQQSNRMKEIANEADRLADNQKIEEEETRDIAVKALNVSTLAYSGIQNLVQAQSEGSLIEVKELQKLIFGMKQMLSRAMNEVCSAAEDANRIYDEVLEFLNHGTSIIVPEFNEQATMYRDFHIINEAIGSIEKTDNILEENPHLDDEIKEKKSKANNILNEAILLQKGKEKLMTDTEAALDKARENVQSGETILNNAKQLLEQVKECNLIVQEYKEEAVDIIEAILSLITESDQKTEDKITSLSKAETVTLDAKAKVRKTESIVSQTFQLARYLEEKAEGTMTRTEYVLQEINYVFQKVLEVADQMEFYEVETEVNSVLTEKVQNKTAKFGHLVRITSLKVQRSLDVLQTITDELETLDSLESADLYRIEYELERLQNEDLVLAEKMKDLQVLKKKQQKLIDELEKSIETVRQEVKESENISEAIKHI